MSKIVKRERITRGVKVRSSEGESPSRRICGRAIVFGSESVTLYEDDRDVVREIIAPEAVDMELLDQSDIKMLLYHNRERILARSHNGEGNLSYSVSEEGVDFEFDAPATADGDTAAELVRSGVLDGCSFAFTADYSDRSAVSMERSVLDDGRRLTVYTVHKITGIYDFTLTADPAYPATSVEARAAWKPTAEKPQSIGLSQIAEMRAESEKFYHD